MGFVAGMVRRDASLVMAPRSGRRMLLADSMETRPATPRKVAPCEEVAVVLLLDAVADAAGGDARVRMLRVERFGGCGVTLRRLLREEAVGAATRDCCVGLRSS